MNEHINNVCKSSFFQLRHISKIRKYLSLNTTQILAHAFVTSKLDNCNSLYYGLPKGLIQKLQRVQNATARLVTCTRKYEHITPVLCELHWLPVEQRVVFKVLLLTFKAQHGLAPAYLSDILEHYKPARCLRSSSGHLLRVPTSNLRSYGDRAFSVAAPSLWNKLPSDVRSCESLSTFKNKLKTHLFRIAFQ